MSLRQKVGAARQRALTLLVGAPPAVEAMRAACESGPALARVDTIDEAEAPGDAEIAALSDGFHIREMV